MSVQSYFGGQVSALSAQAATAVAGRCLVLQPCSVPHLLTVVSAFGSIPWGASGSLLLALVDRGVAECDGADPAQEVDGAGPRCVHLVNPKLSLGALQAVLVYLYTERLEADMDDMEVSRIWLCLYHAGHAAME